MWPRKEYRARLLRGAAGAAFIGWGLPSLAVLEAQAVKRLRGHATLSIAASTGNTAVCKRKIILVLFVKRTLVGWLLLDVMLNSGASSR